ncbi:hypothetical protein EJ03DRAFT_347873 [Teratosphaeria nubilosa]|uniref:Uncharacterized protein n=1 Tax=Teratosphaeria nubilosa TaxID=161662 RepID=A0A6G1LL70_9PEZI|nr:hypothetical protein EJ03DRAFT_347873 [Teratosphaeria nubilosa]
MTSPPVILKQTLQQAKKSYKERGRPTLTSQEQRQLDRSIQLDRRAWGVKEREKKRAEAVRKRAEKARLERDEARKVVLGTQVRKDRFGYKSSQMHLGVFFGGGRKVVGARKEEAFGDGGVDDESLFDALQSPVGGREAERDLPPPPPKMSPAVGRGKMTPAAGRGNMTPIEAVEDDFSCFLDDLGSSTQIARELDTEGTASKNATAKEETCNTSFDSADFNITAEDLEDMSMPPAPARLTKAQSERALMPPPKMPVKSRAQPMPPPPRPVNRMPNTKSSSRAPSIPTNPGFTMAELESFVDDDLQLTQAAPG